MKSHGVIDLRKRKLGASARRFFFREAPERGGKQPSLRARRRRRKVLLATAFIAACAAILYGISFVSYLPEVTIQNVEIAGAKDVSPEALETFVLSKLTGSKYRFLSSANIFLYPQSEIERSLIENFPRVKSAKVARESLLSTTLRVAVEEREAFARWCSGEDCYLVGDNGFIFAPVGLNAEIKTAYVFRGAIDLAKSPVGQEYAPAHFSELLSLLERMEQAAFRIKDIAVENDQDFSLFLTRGYEVRASFGTDPSTLTKNLDLVLSSDPLRGKEAELEYIDLRFGNRVYFKMKGVQQEATNMR